MYISAECISQLSTLVVKNKMDIVFSLIFHPWFRFYFPLLWGMVIYGNEFETRIIKFKPFDKIESQHRPY